MDQGQFLKALDELEEAFFIYEGQLRTRASARNESVDPIVAVAKYYGYKGSDLTAAVSYLKLDLSLAMRIIKIIDGEGVYNPSDLKLKAKILNRTVKKYKH